MEPEHLFSFEAVSDSGKSYSVGVYAKPVDNRVRGGRGKPPQQVFRTSSGEEVKRIRKGQYALESTGETITSDSPDAP